MPDDRCIKCGHTCRPDEYHTVVMITPNGTVVFRVCDECEMKEAYRHSQELSMYAHVPRCSIHKDLNDLSYIRFRN